MSWLIEFIEKIKVRPGMYLGDERLSTLRAYISGYCQAREDLGVVALDEFEVNVLNEFKYWLAVKHGRRLNLDWSGYVEHCFSNNPEESVLEFFKLFDEFMLSYKKTGYTSLREKYEEIL